MKIFFLIIFFIVIFIESIDLITIDLEFNSNDFYRIKNIDSNLNLSFNNKTNISLLPEKYTSLIKLILKNKKYLNNCNKNIFFLNKKPYETFFCEKTNNSKNINNIKLKFNLNTYNITINESELFSKKGKYFYFNFLTNNNISEIVLSTNLLDKNIFIRKLEEQQNEEVEEEEEEEEEVDNKNENETSKNESNRNYKKEKNKKSSIGWIGICLIILLSIIVIYVLYVGFRYYRRKKYQNPSFYYKITEEMFEDITPIE